jgi:hypothetical protein
MVEARAGADRAERGIEAGLLRGHERRRTDRHARPRDPVLGVAVGHGEPEVDETDPAVGEQEHQLAVTIGGEGSLGFLQSARNVGTGNRDRAGVGFSQRPVEGVVVARQRTLQEGLAGEGHEADAARALSLDEGSDGRLGSVEACGTQVADQHRA